MRLYSSTLLNGRSRTLSSFSRNFCVFSSVCSSSNACLNSVFNSSLVKKASFSLAFKSLARSTNLSIALSLSSGFICSLVLLSFAKYAASILFVYASSVKPVFAISCSSACVKASPFSFLASAALINFCTCF